MFLHHHFPFLLLLFPFLPRKFYLAYIPFLSALLFIILSKQIAHHLFQDLRVVFIFWWVWQTSPHSSLATLSPPFLFSFSAYLNFTCSSLCRCSCSGSLFRELPFLRSCIFFVIHFIQLFYQLFFLQYSPYFSVSLFLLCVPLISSTLHLLWVLFKK